ncbi:MAG: DUF6544 family protein [Halobacteriota archaeon]
MSDRRSWPPVGVRFGDVDRLAIRWVLAGAIGVGFTFAFAFALARRSRFERERAQLHEELHAARTSNSGRTYSRNDLEGLPAPVTRYFETVLEDGQPYVRSVRLTQRGQFRLGDRSSPWKRLSATQQFTVDPPGFIWDATITPIPYVPVRVVDAYVCGAGSVRADLGSIVPLARADASPEVNVGELTRYLAEAVWFPTALLPTEGVRWEPIDDRTARATIDHAGTSASLTFHFDDRNLVDRVVAADRPRAVDGGFEQTEWTGYFDEYDRKNRMVVPTAAAVEWNLPDGPLPYWRGTIESIDQLPIDQRGSRG